MLVQAESKVPQELLGRLEPQEPQELRGLKDLKASPVQLAPQVRPARLEQLARPVSLGPPVPRARPASRVPLALLVRPVSQEQLDLAVHKALLAPQDRPARPERQA